MDLLAATACGAHVRGRRVLGGLVLVAVAGVVIASSLASAQSSVIRFEASSNGGAMWHKDVTADPGMTVEVRMSASLSGATALGLGRFTCQPRVANWRLGVDRLVAITFPGWRNNGTPSTATAYDGRAVLPAPVTNTGRPFPFGSAGQGASAASGVLADHEEPGQLWFAGSHTTLMGAQPQWGLSIAQLTQELGAANFTGSLNAEVFRFSTVVGNVGATRTVGLGNHSDVRVCWYLNANGTSNLIVSNPSVSAATIGTVPGPGAVGVVPGPLLVVARRRRE